ncbi:MAG: AAA family ATPase [Alphaproteobacteria bacterium]|nr:AAA family ATPase [Alphaproteobacteria bacterium]
MQATNQAEIEAFLADPATHGGVKPRRFDTHISTIFLAGTLAWKMKKAVTLPFLDFSTLEVRQAACEAEQAVNHRAAPALYQGVVAVTRDSGGNLRLGGDGQPLEWLVKMRRFDQKSLFSRQAATGRLDRAAIHGLTEAVWAFHREAPKRPDRGGAKGLAWTIDTNDTCFAGLMAELKRERTIALTQASRDWLARLTPRLEQRRAAGLVRACHGDLHLGNICVFEGRPTLFDAIEFSDDIASIDVFYDLAFLLMDLERRTDRTLASYALNHYLDLSGDYGGVGMLPLLLSLRAAIRAHVSATIARGHRNPKRRALVAEANAYLDQALAYMSPMPPRLLAVGGLSGSGKSRMGRELAPSLAVPGAAVVRSDSLRKQIMGVGLLDRLGPEGYGPEMTERTYQALYDTCAAILKDGHAVVADAVFAKPEQRERIEAVARAAGVRFDGLWLQADPAVTVERIATRKANVSDATPEVFQRQRDYDLGDIRWKVIDTSGSKEAALGAGLNCVLAG